MARPLKKHKFNEDVENIITKLIYNDEYVISKNNRSVDIANFESVVDMLECNRSEKDYDWMSDVFIPELPSIILTDASGWANQYFQSRDFVEVRLEGSAKEDKKKCNAAKKCINQTLNNRKIYHYHKYIRGRTINSLKGDIYALCWWEQKTILKIIGYDEKTQPLDVDVMGNEIIDETTQERATTTIQEPRYGEDIVLDQFNYDVLHPANVFTDNKYCYSVQDKDFITIRSETTYEELKSDEEQCGYFNLHLVKELKSQTKTETAEETFGRNEPSNQPPKTPINTFDKLLRFGKFWSVVKERADDGYPIETIPGYDRNGEILEKAELVESIIEQVVSGNTKILIRFQPNPYRDSKGRPYRPIVRGWCYIHPTKDTGLADGKYLKELQIAINDGFNMGADREKLATIPTLKAKDLAVEDNSTIYFAPEHIMRLPDVNDVQEFKIDSNISGMLGLVGMLSNMGQQVTAVYPTTMGQIPEKASTTATAVAGAETRTNIRANYKSLTFEYTFLLDFYWLILQMTYQFMRPDTAIKMMGEDAQLFDPDADYSYTPVTSNIEAESNKYRKLQLIDQFIGRLVKVPNPKTFAMINYLMKLAFELFGKEFPDYKDYLFDENAPVPEAGGGRGEGQVKNLGNEPMSNQEESPMTLPEQMTRGVGVS